MEETGIYIYDRLAARFSYKPKLTFTYSIHTSIYKSNVLRRCVGHRVATVKFIETFKGIDNDIPIVGQVQGKTCDDDDAMVCTLEMVVAIKCILCMIEDADFEFQAIQLMHMDGFAKYNYKYINQFTLL